MEDEKLWIGFSVAGTNKDQIREQVKTGKSKSVVKVLSPTSSEKEKAVA